MGGGGSTRRVTFEADENENITVVKGVRLSDSVIDRMKEPSSPTGRQPRGSVNDEELKKRIAEELALERARRDSEAQKRRLKQEQMYVRDEFGKLLERERISSNEHLTRAILRERAATEEERQKAQRFCRYELRQILYKAILQPFPNAANLLYDNSRTSSIEEITESVWRAPNEVDLYL
uniref:Coiled-coil-helix-coiled-coil-helix domain containing 3 n=1 Tax=Taeniopygia guttata TaxID=59729 RepID=H0YUQ3_TAEGU